MFSTNVEHVELCLLMFNNNIIRYIHQVHLWKNYNIIYKIICHTVDYKKIWVAEILVGLTVGKGETNYNLI
jgi:hypothetical protein